LPVTRTPQTHDAPRKGAPLKHDNHKQIIRTARRWRRVSPGKIIGAQTKSALHRTRLQVLDHKNFSVLIFYKSPHRSAALLAFYQHSPTEKSERNFSTFQFFGSGVDLKENSNY